jgi:hypothetical protein
MMLAAAHGREFDLELLHVCSDSDLSLQQIADRLEQVRNQKMVWLL